MVCICLFQTLDLLGPPLSTLYQINLFHFAAKPNCNSLLSMESGENHWSHRIDLATRFIEEDYPHLSLTTSINKDCTQVKLHVGTLQSGQSRNFLLECSRPETMSEDEFLQSFHCKLEYSLYSTAEQTSHQV